jgi:hypothetical protein
MTTAAWWAVGLAAFILAVRFSPGPMRRARHALGRRRQAELRAEALLLGWLSPGQCAQYRARGWFEVVTVAGHRYRVWPHKVVRLDARRSVYCIEAVSRVPVADELLAKKLLLETDERRFLATAHRYR